jgi:hypothetical protein
VKQGDEAIRDQGTQVGECALQGTSKGASLQDDAGLAEVCVWGGEA